MRLSRRQCTIGAGLSLAVLASRGEARQAVGLGLPERSGSSSQMFPEEPSTPSRACLRNGCLAPGGSPLWSKTSLVLRGRGLGGESHRWSHPAHGRIA